MCMDSGELQEYVLEMCAYGCTHAVIKNEGCSYTRSLHILSRTHDRSALAGSLFYTVLPQTMLLLLPIGSTRVPPDGR